MKIKNLFLSMFVLAFSFTFFACGSGGENTEGDEVTSEEGEAKEVMLSEDVKLELNTIFTMLAETYTEPFTDATDKVMINFAVQSMYINSYDLFESNEEGYAFIGEDWVSGYASGFFGNDIQNHQETNDIQYAEGYYFIMEASGEAFQFGRVNQLFENPDGSFEAIATIYSADSGWAEDISTEPSEWVEQPNVLGKMSATLEINGSNEDSHFVVISYTEI